MVDVRRLRNSTEQAGWIASRPDRRGHPGILLRPALTGLPGSASIAPSARRRSPRVSQARETDQVAFFLRIVICYWSTVFGPMFRAFMVLLRSVPLACQPAILPWSRAGYNPAGALEVHHNGQSYCFAMHKRAVGHALLTVRAACNSRFP